VCKYTGCGGPFKVETRVEDIEDQAWRWNFYYFHHLILSTRQHHMRTATATSSVAVINFQ